MDKIQMEILGLSTSPSSGGAYALILNESDSNRRLPIIIGTFEAQAIAMELEHIKSPRPMTHDLMRNIMQSFDSFVKYVYINDLKNGTFYASIVYDNNGDMVEQDSRPSDAIALAIRFNAPIFASSKVMEEAGITSEEEETSAGSDVPSSDEAGSASVTPGASKKRTESTASSTGGSEKSQLERLQTRLEKAIKEENYEKAAQIRDEIEKIKG